MYRSERKVKGAAYCNPVLLARKPEPHMITKYHARSASKRFSARIEDRAGVSIGFKKYLTGYASILNIGWCDSK
jgi:hypothetical protein